VALQAAYQPPEDDDESARLLELLEKH
jgi:hypothetical protein